MKRHFLFPQRSFHFLLITVGFFTSPNKNTDEFTLTTGTVHNKTILISENRKKKLKAAFLKGGYLVCTSPVCVPVVWDVASYTLLDCKGSEETIKCMSENTFSLDSHEQYLKWRNPHCQEHHNAKNWHELDLQRIKTNTTY